MQNDADGNTTRDDTSPVGLSVVERAPLPEDHSVINKVHRITKKIVIAIAGGIIVAGGLALVPLPGPGWLIVLAGLGVWAIEFHWARQLLHFTRSQLQRWWAWVNRQPIWVRLLIALATAAFVAGIVTLSLWVTLGTDGLKHLWEYVRQ
jgi:uncharacterized protein (TIGR02611 family)